MDGLPKLLVILGIVILALGLWLAYGPSVPWLGRLPGDLRIERPGVRIYVPITTSILISVVLSLVLYLIGRLR